MGSLFAYSLSSSVVMTFLYMAYKWAMASERQHALNRAVLWGIYIVALIAPFAVPALSSFGRSESAGDIAIDMADVVPAMVAAVPEQMPSQPLAPVILLWVYLAGMVVVMFHTIVVAVRLAMLVRGGRRVAVQGCRVILIDNDDIAPFSVMNTIVMSRRDFAEAGELILAHECCHVRLMHFVDLLMARVVNILQWYSPASWLMREELRAVHEYQADAGVMASGANVKDYQMLLIKKAVGARFPSLANSLNHSKLKKRITMMYNSPSSGARRLRSLVLVPALGAAVFVTTIPAVADILGEASEATLGITSHEVTQNPLNDQSSELLFALPADESGAVVQESGEKTGQPVERAFEPKADEAKAGSENAGSRSLDEILVVPGHGAPAKDEFKPVEGTATKADDRIYDVVETAPQYPGGMEGLMKRLAFNLKYPEDAQNDSIQGRVVLQFVVDKSGKVVSPRILRGVCPSIDAEALRVVTTLDNFIPGKLKGEPVAVYYTLPLTFKLKKQTSSSAEDRSQKFSWKTLGVVTADGSTISPEGVRVFVGDNEIMSLDDIDPKTIQSVDVIKNDARYPNGAIFITLKPAKTAAE